MYNNIGAKIKLLAKIVAWVGIIWSGIAGIIAIAQGLDMRNGGALIATGLGIIIGGFLVSWISSWFLYGFGELIEKTTEIAKNTARGASSGSLTAKMENDEKMKTLISWRESNLISEEEFEIKKQALLKGE